MKIEVFLYWEEFCAGVMSNYKISLFARDILIDPK